jgi:MFS family permease
MSAFLTPRAAMTVQFLAFGTGVGVWAGSIPSILIATGIGAEAFGLAITVHTAAVILAMTVGGAAMRTMSPKTLMLVSIPCFAVTLTATVLATDPVAFYIAFVCYGAAAGMVDIAMNAEGTQVERDLGRPVLAGFHGAGSAGAAVFSVAASYAAQTAGTWVSTLFVAATTVATLLLILRVTPPRRPLKGSAGAPKVSVVKPALVVFGLIVGVSVAGETAALFWSGRLLEEQAPSLAAFAGLGGSFFAGCQALVRLTGDQWRRFASDRTLVAVSLAVAALGFLMIGISSSFPLTVAGCALVGAGTGLIVPCTFALTVAAVPQAGSAALGFVALLAGVPRLAAPWLFGALTERLSPSGAYAAMGVAFALTVILAAWPKRRG